MKRFFSLQSFAAILAGSVAVASFNPANSMPVSQQVQRVTSDTTGFTSIREGYNHDVYPDRQYYGQRRYNRHRGNGAAIGLGILGLGLGGAGADLRYYNHDRGYGYGRRYRGRDNYYNGRYEN